MDIIVIALFRLVLSFVLDLIFAWVIWLIAPLTGVALLDNLTYWNTFWLAFVISLACASGTVSSKE